MDIVHQLHFFACVEEVRCFKINVKLDIYKRFSKSVEFKKYLHRVCHAGMHGLNEELGRH